MKSAKWKVKLFFSLRIFDMVERRFTDLSEMLLKYMHQPSFLLSLLLVSACIVALCIYKSHFDRCKTFIYIKNRNLFVSVVVVVVVAVSIGRNRVRVCCCFLVCQWTRRCLDEYSQVGHFAYTTKIIYRTFFRRFTYLIFNGQFASRFTHNQQYTWQKLHVFQYATRWTVTTFSSVIRKDDDDEEEKVQNPFT